MGERLLLAVLSVLLTACVATAAHADGSNLDAAIARLEALERAGRNDGEGWHRAHHIVAHGADAASLEAFTRRLHPAGAPLPHRHFAYDATPLGGAGGARNYDGQAHFGQFALVLVRHSPDRALVADVVAGLRVAPRLEQTLRAIEALPGELAELRVPPDVVAWRARPDIRAKKALWSELDISWAVEAIATEAPKGDPAILRLIDAQLALYALDRDFRPLNFVPEYGVHILMMLIRVMPQLEPRIAARCRPVVDAMFDELLARDDHGVLGHLLEVGFEKGSTVTIDAARLRIALDRLFAYVQSDEPKDYGFVTHTLRGLRNLRDFNARPPAGTQPASIR